MAWFSRIFKRKSPVPPDKFEPRSDTKHDIGTPWYAERQPVDHYEQARQQEQRFRDIAAQNVGPSERVQGIQRGIEPVRATGDHHPPHPPNTITRCVDCGAEVAAGGLAGSLVCPACDTRRRKDVAESEQSNVSSAGLLALALAAPSSDASDSGSSDVSSSADSSGSMDSDFSSGGGGFGGGGASGDF